MRQDMDRPWLRWVVVPLFLAAAAAGADGAAPLTELDYRYDATWGSMAVGQMEVSLKADSAPGSYRYTTVSHPTALVRMLYGSPDQTSLFCVKNGAVRSRHFESVLPGDSKQSYTLDFDQEKGTVTDNNGQVRQIAAGTVDSFALQQAVRLWVMAHGNDPTPPLAQFDMVDSKNITHYQFRLGGHQTIGTPAGMFDTLLMERIDNPDKQGRFWLAPQQGYMPVRIETKNGGKPMVRLVLAK